MLTHRKTQIILALLISSVFLFQNCATILSGTSQTIPVTSDPLGAKVIIDGKDMGRTPLVLKLKRKKGHFIRIEKQGYIPLTIIITRKTSAPILISILGNAVYGVIGYYGGAIAGLSLYIIFSGEESGSGLFHACMIGGAILGWLGAISLDYKSGANYGLSPMQLIVTLKKIEGKPQPDLILLDAEQFRRIKWIRIRCAPSDEKDS